MSTEVVDVERRVRELLAEVYKPEGVEIWLNSPNRNLSGNRPAELIAQGWGKDVLREAERLAHGW
jgi:hypothetical protein